MWGSGGRGGEGGGGGALGPGDIRCVACIAWRRLRLSWYTHPVRAQEDARQSRKGDIGIPMRRDDSEHRVLVRFRAFYSMMTIEMLQTLTHVRARALYTENVPRLDVFHGLHSVPGVGSGVATKKLNKKRSQTTRVGCKTHTTRQRR